MRTSRVSRETAKIIEKTADCFGRQQTRSLAAFTAGEAPAQDIKQEEIFSDSSSLSSLSSAAALAIEDFAAPSSPPRKRKRGLQTSHFSATTTVVARVSPRKPVIKDVDDEPTKKIRKARRQPAKQIVNGAGEVEIHPPANWQEIYETVKEMRKLVLAPVDTMGCETLAEENLSPRVSFDWIDVVRESC